MNISISFRNDKNGNTELNLWIDLTEEKMISRVHCDFVANANMRYQRKHDKNKTTERAASHSVSFEQVKGKTITPVQLPLCFDWE